MNALLSKPYARVSWIPFKKQNNWTHKKKWLLLQETGFLQAGRIVKPLWHSRIVALNVSKADLIGSARITDGTRAFIQHRKTLSLKHKTNEQQKLDNGRHIK